MTLERLEQLENEPGATLTALELAQGWHFCPEGDGRLVGPFDAEMEYCECFNAGGKPEMPQAIGQAH